MYGNTNNERKWIKNWRPNVEIKLIKKAQPEGNMWNKNLETQTGISKVSYMNRIQEMNNRLSVIEDIREEIYTIVKIFKSQNIHVTKYLRYLGQQEITKSFSISRGKRGKTKVNATGNDDNLIELNFPNLKK